MTFAFIVPRGAEAQAVRAARPGIPIVTIAAGARAARDLPDPWGDRVAIVLGLCGALRDRRAGDVVVYRALAGDGVEPALDVALADSLLEALPRAHAVRACTSDHVVTRAPERAQVAQRYDADVVDMESASLAAAFGARGIRFAIVRVVSDDATRDLPALERAIDARGRVDVARVAWAFVRDPRGATAFVLDARRALRELTSTARVLHSLVA